MTGSRATGIACLAGTKAVSSRHRRSPLVLCSTTHRGSSRDKSHPGRRRKASKSLCHSVPHLAQLPSPTHQWVLTGLPGSTLLALGVLREGPTFTALSVFLHGDRGFESLFLQRGVSCEPNFGWLRPFHPVGSSKSRCAAQISGNERSDSPPSGSRPSGSNSTPAIIRC